MKKILEFDFILVLIILIITLTAISSPKYKSESREPIIIISPIEVIEDTTMTYQTVNIRKDKELHFEDLVEKPIEIILIEEVVEPETDLFIEIEEIEEIANAAPIIEETENVIKEIEVNKSIDTPEYKTTFDHNSEEVIILAKCLEGEAGALKSDMEKAAVIWCVLNRVDSEDRYYPDDIIGVVTQRYQFTGYNENNRIRDDLIELVLDVLGRWQAEHRGEENIGRVLPKDYLWFYGLTARNTFRNAYEKDKADYWDWSLPNPYED